MVQMQAAIGSILVCWSATGPMVDMVIIEWSLTGIEYGNNATVLNGSNSYAITGLKQGTRYVVGVNAFNSAGDSGPVSAGISTLTETEDGEVCPSVDTVVVTSTTVVTLQATTVTITATPTPIGTVLCAYFVFLTCCISLLH